MRFPSQSRNLIFRSHRWQIFAVQRQGGGAPVLNIEHFRTKLATEGDPAKREMLERLLAEENAKLAALNEPPGEQKPRA
jgi:hypothetical protein